MNKAIIAGLGIVVLAGGIIALVTGSAMWRNQREDVAGGSDFEVDPDWVPAGPPKGADEEWLTRYTLTDQYGNKFESESMQGEVHVVSFFFSSCPSVCWLQNQQIGNLQREFDDEGVKFVSITCDPAIDTPGVLRQYAAKLNAKPGWWFLTAPDLEYLRRIASEVYMVALEKQTHSSRLLLVGRNGEIRASCHFNEPEELAKFKETIHECLREEYDPSAAEPEASADVESLAAEEPPSPE